MAEAAVKAAESSGVQRVSWVLTGVSLSLAVAGFFLAAGRRADFCRAGALIAPLALLAAVLAVIFAHVARRRRSRAAAEIAGQDRTRIALLAGYLSLVIALLSNSNVNLWSCGERWPSGAAAAMRDLGVVNAAEVTYASTYNLGYSPDLASLGPGGGPPSASAAGLIDEVLARGMKNGYEFVYAPGPRDSAGRIMSYTLTARPLKFDRDDRSYQSSFFTDQSGVIRATTEDRPPTVQDPPVGK